jgi:hypothetical protein
LINTINATKRHPDFSAGVMELLNSANVLGVVAFQYQKEYEDRKKKENNNQTKDWQQNNPQ